MRGNQSSPHTYPKLPVSKLILTTLLHTAIIYFTDIAARHQDAFIQLVVHITDTNNIEERTVMHEADVADVLSIRSSFTIYCCQIKFILNVPLMKPFIEIIDFVIMTQEQRTNL